MCWVIVSGGWGRLQACHFLGDGLDPDLEEGEGAGLGADGDGVDVAVAEIGLVEHVSFAREGC